MRFCAPRWSPDPSRARPAKRRCTAPGNSRSPERPARNARDRRRSADGACRSSSCIRAKALLVMNAAQKTFEFFLGRRTSIGHRPLGYLLFHGHGTCHCLNTSHSRDAKRPGWTVCFAPQTRGSGAPKGAGPRLRGATNPRLRGVARTLRSARSPLGAPPWRFLSSGPRFRFRHSRCAGRSARSSRPSGCLAGGFPGPPVSTVASRRRGRHSRLRLQDRLRRRPSKSRDGNRHTV